MAGPIILGCTPDEQQKLRLAVWAARAKLAGGVCGLNGLEPLRRCLWARLYGFRPLRLRCTECEGLPTAQGYTEHRGVGEIAVCRALFSYPQERINSVIFHELIHVCGGNELDAEGLEGHCFNGTGATPPGRGDYLAFLRSPVRDGYHLGNYLMWNPATGQLFVRDFGSGWPGAPLSVRFRMGEDR